MPSLEPIEFSVAFAAYPEFRSSRWFRARSVGENVVFMGVFGVFEAAGVDLA